MFASHPRRWLARLPLLPGVTLAALAFGAGRSALAQTPPTPPAPSNVGTTVPKPYNGAPASGVKKELVGPVLLLRSGEMDLSDANAPTITIPLYKGQMRDGRSVWYILTDTNDQGNADQLGLNYAPKLAYAEVGRAFRTATIGRDATLTFDKGTVDFAPARRLVPGDAPNFFPPKSFESGSAGDADYTPVVKITNAGGFMYNAPVIAFDQPASALNFCSGAVNYSILHDRVAKICPNEGTVTIKLTPIFSFGRPSLYMSMEASDRMVAALDAGTFAPALGDAPVGGDDGAFSAVERLFPIANGPMGASNPQRQGLNSALGDGPLPNGADRPPLNVIGAIPTIALDYSPLWDLNLAVWTQEAIEKGYRARIIDEFQLLGLAQDGWITGMDGKPFGSTGIVVNCPIVFRFL